jgi:DNA-binding transcriptional regulator YhcF (GntR family)
VARPQRSEEITKRIIDLIVERELPPGAPMPTELSLMEDIGVSRNSIREAIKHRRDPPRLRHVRRLRRFGVAADVAAVPHPRPRRDRRRAAA